MVSAVKQSPPDNIFAYLAESSDDDEGDRATVAVKKEAKVSRAADGKTAAQRPQREIPVGSQHQTQATRGSSGMGPRRGRGGGQSSPMADESSGQALDEDFRFGQRGRGGRGFGARRGPPAGGQTRHRVGDRHVSGMGRGRGMKKGGGGGHNWGVPAEDEEHGTTPAHVTLPEANASGEGTGWDNAFIEADATVEAPKQGSIEEAEVRAPEPMIDVQEFNKRKAAMRAGLPTLPSVETRQRSKAAQEDLLKEGYELHVRELDPESRSTSRPDSKNSDFAPTRGANRDGLQSEFFAPPSRPRGRGRGRGRPTATVPAASEEVTPQRGPAPAKLDLSDSHAFPGLI